jgi:hypothetical protein
MSMAAAAIRPVLLVAVTGGLSLASVGAAFTLVLGAHLTR